MKKAIWSVAFVALMLVGCDYSEYVTPVADDSSVTELAATEEEEEPSIALPIHINSHGADAERFDHELGVKPEFAGAVTPEILTFDSSPGPTTLTSDPPPTGGGADDPVEETDPPPAEDSCSSIRHLGGDLLCRMEGSEDPRQLVVITFDSSWGTTCLVKIQATSFPKVPAFFYAQEVAEFGNAKGIQECWLSDPEDTTAGKQCLALVAEGDIRGIVFYSPNLVSALDGYALDCE